MVHELKDCAHNQREECVVRLVGLITNNVNDNALVIMIITNNDNVSGTSFFFLF